MEREEYKLRASLSGHSMDVRGVATGTTADKKEFLVSVSRDKTSKIWTPSGNGDFEVYQTCEGHTNFVICACVVQPSEAHPNGLILTGGNDHTILVFELGAPNPIYRLASHKGTVCSIAVTSGSEMLIVSGSWDMTAKIWRGQDNIDTLVGHSQAVWTVATVPGGSQILTGSADREIRLWDKSATIRTYRGHSDCVRDVAFLDKDRFISCSNDAQIILWNVITAESVHTFYGHTNFIYSVGILPNDEGFVSVGEDKTLRIWKGSEPQVIYLPALSVWSVAVMENGDIITGSSDGVVRIFTCEPERMASEALQKEFEESVTKSKMAAQLELGGMKITDLPGPEALLGDGKSDGATKMINDGGNVICYAWSEAERKWNKVGDVVGASGATQDSSGRVLYEGVEYDYVFNVAIDDAGASLKLPYNITEDPWFAAQKFLEKNNLEQSFLDQVANFIMNNSKGVVLGTTPVQYSDPFTGGSRYIPGSSSAGPQVGASTATPATLLERARNQLKSEGIKLWLEPYYNVEAKMVSDGEIISLANRFSTELGTPIDEVVDCLFTLQKTALERLAERELKKMTQ